MSSSLRFGQRGAPRRLAAGLVVVIGGIALAVVGAPSFGQEQPDSPIAPLEPPSTKPHAGGGADCRDCHTCDKPTAENPCLRLCSRPREAELTAALAQGDVPQGVILLDMLSDVTDVHDHFGPVPFDHAGHAKWAEIAGGCTICHHYTPEGAAHPTCRTCHEIAFKHVDIRKPGLKGAYHRQCMGCHREWTHETKCSACHVARVGEGGVAAEASQEVPVDAMHKPIPEPDVEIYQIKPGEQDQAGTRSIFRHKEHTQRFGLKCAECHRGDSCLRCHEEGRQHEQRVRTLAEHHNPCSDCHVVDDEDSCGHCHWQEGDPQIKPFDHANTGWPLSRFHKENNCRICHKAARFVKLPKECNACHSGWEPESFNHAVTGQTLDENHVETDCEECHIDRKFDTPPSCDECHDEDEGITFPAKRPGPFVEENAGVTTKPAARTP